MATKLTAAERQAQIVELLSNNGTMKAIELADYFQVSRETIRRDLIALNEAGTVKKWFGGAMPVNDFRIQPVDARTDNQEIKMRICQKALDYIPDHAVLFLDTGSTVLCMAQLLKDRSGYTIITNSIPVINVLLESNNQVIITGGSVNQQIMSVMGLQTVSFLEKIKLDVAILGSSGYDRHKGPTSNNLDDGQIKHVVIDNAQTSIVLADSRKATHSSLTQYASWRDIDYLITDDGMSPQKLEALKEQTDVILA